MNVSGKRMSCASFDAASLLSAMTFSTVASVSRNTGLAWAAAIVTPDMVFPRSGPERDTAASVRQSPSRGSAVDEPRHPVGDERRLRLALDLDSDRAHQLDVGRVTQLRGLEHAGCADLRADLDRRDEAHLVEAVVHAHQDPVEALRRLRDGSREVRQQ